MAPTVVAFYFCGSMSDRGTGRPKVKRACLVKMGPFSWATVPVVKMAFYPFGNGRKRVICMGEQNGAGLSKQAQNNLWY